MRILLSTTALALVLGLASPAHAQMCGSGKTGATSAGATATGGMCGSQSMTGQAPAATPETSTSKSSGMCPCCRNMAMMGGGQGGGMTMPGHSMPGIEMPKPQ